MRDKNEIFANYFMTIITDISYISDLLDFVYDNDIDNIYHSDKLVDNNDNVHDGHKFYLLQIK